MGDSIIKGVGKGFKQLGGETAEKLVEEGHKVLESTITGKELLGLDGETMTEKEMVEKSNKDNVHKENEINKVKAEVGVNNQVQQEKGRDVEGEIKQVREEKKKDEELEEQEFLENLKKQREEEAAEEERAMAATTVSSNPAKQKKSRGSAFAKNKKGGVDQSQMSQTNEFKGKI
jgi:hypothetical protein